jgi:hypothetical protein
MSLNVGGILVAAGNTVTQDAVAQQIKAYWLARGAVEDPRDPLEIDALSLEEDPEGRLGYAISPPVRRWLFGKRWIAVADSERYNADWGLAQHLATTFACEVCWYTIYGATDMAECRMLNSRTTPPSGDEDYSDVEAFVSRFPNAFLYFDQLEEMFEGVREAFRLLGFRGVSYDNYDIGPDGDDNDGDDDD